MPNLSSRTLLQSFFACCVIVIGAGSRVSANDDIAQWRQDAGIFRIGVVTRGDALTAQRLSLFTEHLQQKLETPVDLLAARDAVSVIDAIASGQIDYAVMSGAAFATANRLCECAEALVSASTSGGHTHIVSVLLAPENTAASDVQEAFAGPAADFASHQVPMAAIKDAGALSPQLALEEMPSLEVLAGAVSVGDGRSIFAWSYASGSTVTVEDLVPSGFAAILLASLPDRQVIWVSKPYRLGPHAVHESVPPPVRATLAIALERLHMEAPLAFDAVSPTLGGPLVRAQTADYEAYAEIIGMLSRGGE